MGSSSSSSCLRLSIGERKWGDRGGLPFYFLDAPTFNGTGEKNRGVNEEQQPPPYAVCLTQTSVRLRHRPPKNVEQKKSHLQLSGLKYFITVSKKAHFDFGHCLGSLAWLPLFSSSIQRDIITTLLNEFNQYSRARKISAMQDTQKVVV